eukprot:gene26909-biopygen17491
MLVALVAALEPQRDEGKCTPESVVEGRDPVTT